MRDERGTVIVVFGIIVSIVFICIGSAVDMGRWVYARQATMSALDSAVLAGGRALQLKPDDVSAALQAARAFYQQNAVQHVNLQSETVEFFADDNNKSISARGNAYLETTFLKLAGIDKLPILNLPGAEWPKAMLKAGGEGGSNLEVSLILDVTGSMCPDGNGPCTSGTKIDGLKSSAKDLIDIVVWSDQSTHTSRVAVVPFSTRIRVGQDGAGSGMMKLLTNLDPTWTGWYNDCDTVTGGGGTSEGGGTWTCTHYTPRHKVGWKVMPCVTDRYYDGGAGYDYTDDAPGSSRWFNAHGGDRMTLSFDSSDTAPGVRRGLVVGDPADNWNYDDVGDCADVSNANELLPLTADKSALTAKINNLEAYGATAGALGTAFGWYTLSPKWNSIFTGASAPGSYSDLTAVSSSGAPFLRKVAVIMSDGVYNTYRGWKDQDQQAMSDHAKQICSNMKAQGIEVYTVGFALDQLAAGERAIARDTLMSCGTDVQHFYETLNVTQMQQAFRDIALKLSSLYLGR